MTTKHSDAFKRKKLLQYIETSERMLHAIETADYPVDIPLSSLREIEARGERLGRRWMETARELEDRALKAAREL